MPEPLTDRAARDRIARDLTSTLFVDAGAGSGKTRELVNRVFALVADGGVELAEIAAITFTDKAATELRDRLRGAFDEGAGGDGPAAERCRTALGQLDAAPIGTLHAFAHRILSEHPVEAGLPPRVEVLDEVSSEIEFDRRWIEFRDELLADPAIERTLLLLLASGVKVEALRVLAAAFDENWDLVAERVPAVVEDPPDVAALVGPALAAVDAACAFGDHCIDADDLLLARMDALAEYARSLRSIADDVDLLDKLDAAAVKAVRPRYGRAASWRGTTPEEVRRRANDALDALEAIRERVANGCARRLGAELRRFTLAAADERRAAGRLEFHDLLVLARSVLTDPVHGPPVRASLHERYRRLLLDEFQDTDPIQIELAVRIAAVDPEADAAGAGSWSDVATAPGRLFFVGDPKQSIYRFRRADIATYLEARRHLGEVGGGLVELTSNFRTTVPVLDWVNHVFARLMSEEPDVEVPLPSQPDYIGLSPTRTGAPDGAPVAVVGRNEHPLRTGADEVREAEATDIAAAIAAAAGNWAVADAGENGGWRPARLGDIAVLIPTRTSLPFLEAALDEAGIAYRAESSSLVYATRAVRDLMMVARAVDDPTDQLAVVSTLRTPLFGCGDDDLFRFRAERGGSWGYLAPPRATVPPDDPVRVGLECLAELHRRRYWLAPSELLDEIARERRAFELAFAEGRPRDVWGRLRFVIDQARAWSDATGGSLREYLHWVGRQTAQGARVAEAVLPETDDDAVRILTVHAAKGLEFPLVFLSGLSSRPQTRAAPAEVAFPPDGTVGYRFGSRVCTEEFGEWAPLDEQMNFDERVRLLYVACTRARDHLVVSLHRVARRSPPRAGNRTNAELLVDGMGQRLEAVPDAVAGAHHDRPASPAPLEPPPPFSEWLSERQAALARASVPSAVAATALTEDGERDVDDGGDAGLQKRPLDLDLPPWLKGRYGTAVGRAVHGVMQAIDLATGAGAEAAIVAQCQAEAVVHRAADVDALVRHALSAPTVKEAAALPHWREVYVCVPIGDRLLEGYVDLLYRTTEGLVVVDYKTAATADAAELDRRIADYRAQGASYALAVAQATGERVARVVFVFLTPSGAVERELGAVDAAVREVRRAMASPTRALVEVAPSG